MLCYILCVDDGAAFKAYQNTEDKVRFKNWLYRHLYCQTTSNNSSQGSTSWTPCLQGFSSRIASATIHHKPPFDIDWWTLPGRQWYRRRSRCHLAKFWLNKHITVYVNYYLWKHPRLKATAWYGPTSMTILHGVTMMSFEINWIWHGFDRGDLPVKLL